MGHKGWQKEEKETIKINNNQEPTSQTFLMKDYGFVIINGNKTARFFTRTFSSPFSDLGIFNTGWVRSDCQNTMNQLSTVVTYSQEVFVLNSCE